MLCVAIPVMWLISSCAKTVLLVVIVVLFPLSGFAADIVRQNVVGKELYETNSNVGVSLGPDSPRAVAKCDAKL